MKGNVPFFGSLAELDIELKQLLSGGRNLSEDRLSKNKQSVLWQIYTSVEQQIFECRKQFPYAAFHSNKIHNL